MRGPIAKAKAQKKRTLATRKSVASPPRYGIVVLGMHRSGTSALTAALGSLGCDLPKTLMGPSEINPKGSFESDTIRFLNDALIESAGTEWHDWCPVYPGWFNSPKAGEFHNLANEALRREFGVSHLFVLKDPRICRFAPFWFDIIESMGYTPLVVHPHRHPLEVAASLGRVAGYKQTFSTLLWLRHVLDAEIGSRGRPRVFTSYNALMEDWVGVTDKIAAGFGLEWPRAPEQAAAEINSFLDPALRHFSSSPSLAEEKNMPIWVRETNNILIKWAITGEDPEDHATFDRIRTEAETASSNLATIIREEPENLRKIAHLENLRDELQAKFTQKSETRRNTEERITQLSDGLANRQEEIEALKPEVTRLTTEYDTSQTHTNQITAALETSRGNIDLLRTEISKQTELQSGLEERIVQLSTALEKSQGELDTLRTTAEQEIGARTKAEKSAERLVQEVEDIRKDRDGFRELLAQETQALEGSKATLADAKHESGQLRSALLQRQQETEDLSRSGAEDKKRIVELTGALESAREERFRLERHLARNEQNLTLLTGRVAEIMRMEITNSLAGDAVSDLKAENRSLQEDVELFQAEAARAQSLQQEVEALRIEAARAQSLQQEAEALRTQTGKSKAALEEQSIQQSQERASYEHRIAELEKLHDQVLQSISWKITGPLRKVIMIIRNSLR